MPMTGKIVAHTQYESAAWEADRLAVEVLQRSDFAKDVMIDTLAPVMQSSQSDGGGHLSTHRQHELKS